MGGCTSSQKKPQRSNSVPLAPTHKQVEKLPIDTSEVYSFQVTISRLKLRGLPRVIRIQDSYSLKVEWGSQSYSTPLKEGEEVKWNNEWTFDTQAPVSSLQENYLTVSLTTGKGGDPISQVFICLWDIVTGPSYQNFILIDSKHRTIGRVGLDVKVMQLTQIHISPTKVSCNFLHEETGHYSVNILCAEKTEIETPHSTVSDVPKWVFAHDDFRPMDRLELELQTTIESLRTASLQFRIWKHHKHESLSLCGECWVDFNKLLKDERFSALRSQLSKTIVISKEMSSTAQIDTILQQKDAKIERELEEKLWCSGKHVGALKISVVVTNFPFIAQLIAGVNTEDGVRLQSVSFMDGKTRSKAAVPQMVKDFANQMEKLKEYLNSKPRGVIQIRSTVIKNHIADVQEITKKLMETEKESMISHIYHTEMELIEAQQIFLDLGEYMLKYADIVAYEVKGYYFECLSQLIKRGELDLGHVSLERPMEPGLKAKKTDIGVRYRAFLRKLLTSALAKMNLKGADQKVQEFSEAIFAVSYFRIPEFKDRILSALKKKSFDVVPEWRGTTFDLEEDVTTHSDFLPMFNWEPFFYSFLPPEDDPKYLQAITDDHWQNRMVKRGLAYFRFVAEWATLVKRVFVHTNVPYEDIPGYTVILKSFLLEMKERRIEEYPEAMLNASRALLYNPQLVSVFILITFQKTNLHRFEAVMETYHLTNEWLTFLYENGHLLPPNFLHSLFTAALTLTLKDEIALNIANTIWLLLRNYHILHPDTKKAVVLECLLGSEANRIMFHWSEVVRQFFWNFLMFRVKTLSLCPIEPLSKIDEAIAARAEELISIITDHEDIPHERISTDLLPYIPHSKKEYEAKLAFYHEWLALQQPILSAYDGKRLKYGPFGEYPFPDIKVEKVFEDEVENKLEEEW